MACNWPPVHRLLERQGQWYWGLPWVSLPPAPLLQVGEKFLECRAGPHALLKAFPRFLIALCFKPHFLVGRTAPQPLALPASAASPPITAWLRGAARETPSLSSLFASLRPAWCGPCLGGASPLSSGHPTLLQASADHHLPSRTALPQLCASGSSDAPTLRCV